MGNPVAKELYKDLVKAKIILPKVSIQVHYNKKKSENLIPKNFLNHCTVNMLEENPCYTYL